MTTGQPTSFSQSEIWFLDGNIILQTATTQYRVHRGILSLHSSVFKDMFSLPQPEGENMVEGCPVVELSDSSEDWDAFLPVIYSIRTSHDPITNIIPCKLMISMLRLGHKYDFQYFRDDALRQLKLVLPDTVEGWDATYPGGKLEQFSGFIDDFEFDLLNAALELGIQTVLPAAYYACIRDRPLIQILHGFDRENDTRACLAYESQQILVLAKEDIQRTTAKTVFAFYNRNPDEALVANSESCLHAIIDVLETFFGDMDVSMALDPLETNIFLGGLCTECQTHLKTAHHSIRQNIYANLPSYFNLPGWADLKDFYK